MKDTLYIIIAGLFIYLGFATILGDSALMGSFGADFAAYNHLFFGYISYIYIFLLLIPLFYFYRHSDFDMRATEILLSTFLLLFTLLLSQAMLVEDELRGRLGGDFADLLSPYIGTFGLWVLWSILFLVSTLILLDKSASEVAKIAIQKLTPFFEPQEKAVSHAKREQENPKEPTNTKSKRREAPLVEEESSAQESEEDPFAKIADSFFGEADEQKDDFAWSVVDQKEAPIRIKKVDEKGQRELDINEPVEDSHAKEEEPQPHTIVELANRVKQKKGAVIVDELEENTKLLESIEKGSSEKPKNFKLPSLDFLQKAEAKSITLDESEIDEKIKYLIDKLAHFKIEGDVVRTYAGPVVSTFEFKPAANVKVSKILNLQDDLAMALSAQTIRIQAPIPGKDVVGIEIPNDTVDTIYLREILESKLFKESASPLTMALGKDIVGKPFITDLRKLPHLLIAGTTGSGKSVGINAMILSLLYKNSPDQLRLLMIDPKMLEFSIYNDIPHLLTPVITKPKQAIVALSNMVAEMERRYTLMSQNKTKNIENYNQKVKEEGGEHFPYIVVIIDELADLMMTSGKDVEYSIARLAQMARASGIHLIVATQRPSVDVVTGLIKANLPSRISYRVGQRVDSKIILDQQGAESLLGRGDMLFTPPGATGLVRLHAPWSTEKEIEKIVDFIKSQREPNYDKSFLLEESELSGSGGSNEIYEELDPLYDEAKSVILQDRKTSISYLQRKLQIGYNRSARVIEQLEAEGILSAPNSKGIREIL